MKSPFLAVYPVGDLPKVAAHEVARCLRKAVQRRGVAHMALSGGSTPRPLYRLLATPEWLAAVPWAQVHVWWADERCVPPDHHESNYGMAYSLLLGHLPVQHIHRLHGEAADPEAAARAYEDELRRVFGLGPRGRPRFDLILLGMGADGHTASLFPGTAALAVRNRLVAVGQAPQPPHCRLTLTLPVLNRAARVLFLVAGADKGPALAQVWRSAPGQAPLPAALVRPTRGSVLWLVDEAAAAAAGLKESPITQ
ncbi:MAG: 6-phosphogluconolactonase [Anaerolineae bacterium]|nr:6-phosphogluconolactonase [Anaerolineae bacterium]